MNIDKMNVNSQMTEVIQKQNNSPALDKENLTKEKTEVKEQPAAVYEKGKDDKSTGTIYNKEMIQQLKRETENNKLRLLKIVQDSISRQGNAAGLANLPMLTSIDEQARKEAEALIAEDGELGVEKTSQRLVDFAKAISNGDTSKAGLLRDAIEKGFKEAEKMLGGKLPQISQDTYDRTMELFDEWAKGEVKETEENK